VTLKCQDCGKDVRKLTSAWSDWLKLSNLLEFLYSQELITHATYEEAFNALLRFKRYADEEDEGKE
jgi:hypothetical protein